MIANPLRWGLILAFIVIVLDQISKWSILIGLMQPLQRIPLTPFFNLVSAWNRGVSFGMFSSDESWSRWVLSSLAIVIVAFLVNMLRKTDKKHNVIAIGLIVGGALGNVIDRIVHGAVFDFLDIHIAGYHWPAFNVADSGITIGAVILILDSLFSKQENTETSA